MPEKEPSYFKEFRMQINERFDNLDSKFATKEDLKSFATKEDIKVFATKEDLKSFATKSDLELMDTSFKRHVTDLTSGFNDKIKGVCDHVASIDEKVSVLQEKFSNMDHKITTIAGDVFHIKEVLKEKTDKKEALDLKKRIIKLEAHFA